MGFFYYIKSVALIEDLNIEEDDHNPIMTADDFYSLADKKYALVSRHCPANVPTL